MPDEAGLLPRRTADYIGFGPSVCSSVLQCTTRGRDKIVRDLFFKKNLKFGEVLIHPKEGESLSLSSELKNRWSTSFFFLSADFREWKQNGQLSNHDLILT